MDMCRALQRGLTSAPWMFENERPISAMCTTVGVETLRSSLAAS